MRRFRTTDGGSRYLAVLPFARELSAEERDGVEAALSAAAFEKRHRYSADAIDTREVDVTASEARVTFALSTRDDYTPADVLGQLSRAVGAWHGREGPLDEPTRAGGEQSVHSLDAPALGTDRDPDAEGSAGPHTYLLAYPDRRLGDEEVDLLEHVTDDTAVVTPEFIALTDAFHVGRSTPTADAFRRLRENLRGHVDADHALRTPEFFGRREVGTLAAVDAAAREALRERGRRETPVAAADSEGEEVAP